MIDLHQALKISQKICTEAGNFIKTKQRRAVVKKDKGDYDFATNVDLLSEKLIIKNLTKNFPSHNIYSEEKGRIDRESDYCWFIDPLDGTKEFLRQMPAYSVNLSLEYKKELILGVVYYPPNNSLYSVAKNLGTFFNGQKVSVSKRKDLKEAFIFSHIPDSHASLSFFNNYWQSIARVSRKANKLRGREHDIESLCLVARGCIEGHFVMVEPKKWGPQWWDVAAGILMVRQAGGIVTDLDGNFNIDHHLSRGLVASNGKIHEQLLKVLHA